GLPRPTLLRPGEPPASDRGVPGSSGRFPTRAPDGRSARQAAGIGRPRRLSSAVVGCARVATQVPPSCGVLLLLPEHRRRAAPTDPLPRCTVNAALRGCPGTERRVVRENQRLFSLVQRSRWV